MVESNIIGSLIGKWRQKETFCAKSFAIPWLRGMRRLSQRKKRGAVLVTVELTREGNDRTIERTWLNLGAAAGWPEQ